MAAIIQVWSAPSCQTGALCFGALAPWLSAAGSESAGTPASFRLTVTRDVADRASLSEGRCLRVISQSRGEQWWFVSSVSDSDGDAGIVQVTAGPLRQLLTVRGLVRSGSTFAFTPGKRTVTDLLNTYVLTNLGDDGLSWISLGTVDYPDTLEIGTLDRTTRAGVLDAIERQTGHSARLRALTSGGVLTGFAVDVVADLGAGLDTVLLSAGVQQVQRTRDALRAATVVVPFAADGSPIQMTEWLVDSITGSAPAWLALRDPVTGNPWPIREDDQVNGLYVEQRDGTQTTIADARASDSAVQVASVGTLAAGDLVRLVRDTDGNPVVQITSPSGLSSSRGQLVATAATRVTDARYNLVRNSALTAWSTLTAPTWYTVSSSGGVSGVAQYARDEGGGTANVTYQLDGAVGAGVTTIALKGGTAGKRLYRNEALGIDGRTYYVADSVVTVDSGGLVTVTLVSATTIAHADGATVTLTTNTDLGSNALRPPSFPDEPSLGAVARLLYGGATLTSLPSIARASAGTPTTIGAACGVSVRVGGLLNDLKPSTYWPTLSIRNTTSGTALQSVATPDRSAQGTFHYTLETTTTITSDTQIAARVTAGTEFSGRLQWQGVRWLSLWLGGGATLAPDSSSRSNALWHRAQDVLANAASGTRYTVRGVDLTRLQTENGALALGQSVRLRSALLGVDATVKIVKLDYDFAATESLNLELGAITPRLTGVTVSL